MLREEMGSLALHIESSVAIYGTGDFAELIYLGLKELRIEEIDIFVLENIPGRRFLGMPIRNVSVMQPEYYDRVIVGDLDNVKSDCAELFAHGVTSEQLVTLLVGNERGAKVMR